MVALGYSTSKAIPPLPGQYSGMLSSAAAHSTWRYLLTLFPKAARRGESHVRHFMESKQHTWRQMFLKVDGEVI